MDGLRKHALVALSQIKFEPVPAEHELITVDSAAGAQPHRRPLALPEILRLYREEAAPSPCSLRLVKLHIRHPPVYRILEAPILNTSRDDIVGLWDLFNLDPTVLQLVASGIRGINQHHPAIWSKDTESVHFMFSSYLYSVIWTYHPRTQSTSGVILVRPKTSHNVRTDLEPWWEALRFQAGIIKHPLCLFIVTAMQVHHARTHGSLESQGQISHIERMTGFSPWSHETHDTNKPVDPVSVGLDELSLASRTIGAVLVSLEDHVRQLRSLRKAVEAYTQAGFTNVSSVKESADVVLALQVLSQHMDAWEIRLDYLQGRARNQLTVLFNLIARYDAASSMAIARSARRDSASMKVIAIMTMVFLPATFLAALFAVPSLRWDSSPVIQDNFWVYWAFAIPSTIAVFIFWLWLSGDGPTWRSLWSQPTLLKDESSASPTPTRSPSQRQWLSASITESLRRRAIAAKIPV